VSGNPPKTGENPLNPAEIRQLVLAEVRQALRPELLNRIDEIIVFNNLGLAEITKIVGIQIDHLKRRLQEKRIELRLTDAAKELLAKEGFDPVFGARPLKRAIQRLVQDPLALKILEGQFAEGDQITVDAEAGQIVFR
jgi:ATP-dependent Clp protease ATP-binding subunit ClpB